MAVMANEEERALLRRAKLAQKATPEQVEAFLAASAPYLTEKARAAFLGMGAEQQYRAMHEGPLTECADATEVLYGRVRRFMDMESQLKKLANADTTAKESKPKEKRISELAIAVGKALVSTSLAKEVPEHESRFAPPATSSFAPEDTAGANPLVGTCKGVGGVIEALQKKYSMAKGERARVVAETKELWKFEDDRNVPKTHVNQGWKWVVQGAQEERGGAKGAQSKGAREREAQGGATRRRTRSASASSSPRRPATTSRSRCKARSTSCGRSRTPSPYSSDAPRGRGHKRSARRRSPSASKKRGRRV